MSVRKGNIKRYRVNNNIKPKPLFLKTEEKYLMSKIRILDKRASGKSSRLLLLAKENNAIIVCASPELMREKAYRYGITGIDYISYSTYLNDCLNNTIDATRKYLIDELEGFFTVNLLPLDGYTLSIED